MNSYKKACCFRILTIIIGVLIWLIGGAFLGFSIYLRVDFWISHYSEASDELTKYTITLYVFIAVGAIVVLFTIVGIYGAARPNKCALIVYLTYLALVLVLIICSGVYGYVYRQQIKDSVQNLKLLTGVVVEKYGVDSRVSQGIDFMQKELHCCGGQSYTDYRTSKWALNVRFAKERMADMLPLTCCRDDTTRYEDVIAPSLGYCPVNKLMMEPNDNIYKTGCSKALVQFFQKNIHVVASIAFSIVGLLVLAIVFAALLLFYLRKSPALHEDDVVYEMARTQEKSPYPARGGPYANLYQS